MAPLADFFVLLTCRVVFGVRLLQGVLLQLVWELDRGQKLPRVVFLGEQVHLFETLQYHFLVEVLTHLARQLEWGWRFLPST